MTAVQRYTWEDALIDAQASKVISNGALLVALKLSKAINWNPTKRQQPGLYWKNEDALKAVGSSRASYFKHRQSLFETGFFTEVNGNLIPTLPQSLVETTQSSVETSQSLVETEKSLGDNPFSEDILSEDICSEDNEVETEFSLRSNAKAKESKAEAFTDFYNESPASSDFYNEAAPSTDCTEEGGRQSLVETAGENYVEIVPEKRISAEEAEVNRILRQIEAIKNRPVQTADVW